MIERTNFGRFGDSADFSWAISKENRLPAPANRKNEENPRDFELFAERDRKLSKQKDSFTKRNVRFSYKKRSLSLKLQVFLYFNQKANKIWIDMKKRVPKM